MYMKGGDLVLEAFDSTNWILWSKTIIEKNGIFAEYVYEQKKWSIVELPKNLLKSTITISQQRDIVITRQRQLERKNEIILFLYQKD
jgi:hypothetical protein